MFVVYDKNMNIKEFPKSVWPLDIYVHSIEKNRSAERAEGSSRLITKGQTHTNRPIEIRVGLMAHDTIDYRLLRDVVYEFFDDEEFYISELYQRGKKYKVTTLQSYIPERLNNRVGQASFMLDLVELPFAESIGTTQDIQRDGVEANDALWGFGMGLIANDESLIYTHSSTSFRIFNAGNVPIHPFEQQMKIKIDNIIGATSFLELRNNTTGNVFRINESASGTIILDGPNITKNSLNYLRKTNKEFIELAPGWNEFSVHGATGARISYEFPFYYK